MPSQRRDSQSARAAAFGGRIRQLRRAKKLTLKAAAEPLPMSGANLSRIENGTQGPPADEVIARIAEVLGGDEAELLRLAGRSVDPASLERRVLSELRSLRTEVQA